MSYGENLRSLKPDYIIHGKDWRKGLLAKERARDMEVIAEWDGEVIEPDYTEGISSGLIQESVFKHVRWNKELTYGG